MDERTDELRHERAGEWLVSRTDERSDERIDGLDIQTDRLIDGQT